MLESSPDVPGDTGILPQADIPPLTPPATGPAPTPVPLSATGGVTHWNRLLQQVAGAPMFYDSGERVDVIVPLGVRSLVNTPMWLGGWAINTDGPNYTFTFQGEPSNVTWNPIFCVDGLQIVSVDPVPTTMDGNRVTWEINEDPAAAAQCISVTTTAPREAWLNQLISTQSLDGAKCERHGDAALAAGSPGGANNEPVDPTPAGRSPTVASTAPASVSLESILPPLKQIFSTFVLAWALVAPAALLAFGVWRSNPYASPARPPSPDVVAAWDRLKSATIAVWTLAVLGVLALIFRNSNFALLPYRLVESIHQNGLLTANTLGALWGVVALTFVLLASSAAYLTLSRGSRESWWKRVASVEPGIAFMIGISCLVLAIIVVVILVDRQLLAATIPPEKPLWLSVQPPLEKSFAVTGYIAFLLSGFTIWNTIDYKMSDTTRRILIIVGVSGLIPCLFSLLKTNLVPQPHPMVVIALAIMTALFVTGCVVAGFWLLIIALLPMEMTRLKSDAISLVHYILAGTVIVVIVVLQWLVALYNQSPFSDRATVDADITALDDILSKRLQDDVADYLFAFMKSALDLLPILGLVGLFGVLSAAARDSHSRIWEQDDWWVRRVLGFLFAAFVVGYGGQILALQAPLSFVIGLLLFPLATSDFSSNIPGAPSLNTDQNSGGAGETANLAGAASGSQESASPGWWETGLLGLRHGGILAVLPISYFISVLITSRLGLGADQSVPAAFIAPIAWEVAFWLTAAFVFGCAFDCLRGENGLQKGAALAAIYAAANIGAAVVGVTGDPLWMVRSFQLWLFLMVLGIWIEHDLRGVSWAQLFEDFDVDRTRNIAKHLVPVLTALGVVITQLLQSNAGNAITSLISESDHFLCFAGALAGAGNC
jgi:hypothetical protein